MKNKLHFSKTVKLAFLFLFSVIVLIVSFFSIKISGIELTWETVNSDYVQLGYWMCGYFLACCFACYSFVALVDRLLRKFRRLKHPEKPLTVREQAQDLRDLPDEKLVALVKQKKPVDPMASVLSNMFSNLFSYSMSDFAPPRSDEGGDHHEN